MSAKLFRGFSGLAALLLLPGCSDDFLGIDLDSDGDSSDDVGDDDPLPSEGIRVHPQYQLTAVTAVVSVEVDGGTPVSCPAVADGYFCDTADLPGASLTLRVERDGYQPEARESNRPQGYVDDIAVHLVPVGGPVGSWSACVLRDEFPSCEEVCAAEGLVCAPTSCASDDPQEPIATVLGFEGEGCVDPASRVEAQACSSAHPAAFVDSLRCCCQA